MSLFKFIFTKTRKLSVNVNLLRLMNTRLNKCKVYDDVMFRETTPRNLSWGEPL